MGDIQASRLPVNAGACSLGCERLSCQRPRVSTDGARHSGVPSVRKLDLGSLRPALFKRPSSDRWLCGAETSARGPAFARGPNSLCRLVSARGPIRWHEPVFTLGDTTRVMRSAARTGSVGVDKHSGFAFGGEKPTLREICRRAGPSSLACASSTTSLLALGLRPPRPLAGPRKLRGQRDLR